MEKRLKRRVIGVLCRQDVSVKRLTLLGIARFAREVGNWELELLIDGIGDPDWQLPPGLDGLIAWPDNPEQLRQMNRLSLPGVCLGHRSPSRHARVLFDNETIGALIADYFLKAGLRHFAMFCESHGLEYSNARQRGFRQRLKESGKRPANFNARGIRGHQVDWDRWLERISIWLEGLPKPVGVLADRDSAGFDLLRVCRHVGLHVPDQVAVVAIGSDQAICELSQPSLSAVSLPGNAYGYSAARMLDTHLQEGKKTDDLVFDTFVIEERESSNHFAGEDPAIVAALRYIRDHVPQGLSVDDVARAVGVSRRPLEMRFRKARGQSPYEEIIRARVRLAEELLAKTDLPLAALAERTGFREPARLAEAFRRIHGMAPGAFRRKMAQEA